jgi:hypothetical protein
MAQLKRERISVRAAPSSGFMHHRDRRAPGTRFVLLRYCRVPNQEVDPIQKAKPDPIHATTSSAGPLRRKTITDR